MLLLVMQLDMTPREYCTAAQAQIPASVDGARQDSFFKLLDVPECWLLCTWAETQGEYLSQ
jgi:hypothetical protein